MLRQLPQPSRPVIGSLLALCAVLASLAALPSAAHARPSLGVNVVDPLAAGELSKVEALGAERVRAFIVVGNWQSAPYQPLNSSIATAYKGFVTRMASRGIKVDFTVVGSAGGSLSTPPSSPDHYADFMRKLASVFVGQGVSYELWNEPDETAFWSPSPSPAAYAALVKAAYPAIKSVDPNATVVLGATTGNNYKFIESLYQQGIKGNFDAAGVHTDTACLVAAPSQFYREDNRIGRYTFLGYKEVRASMLANGDDKPVWMTEFGWSATNGGPTSCQRGVSAGKKASGVSEATQADYLTHAVRCMTLDPYVQVASWFTLDDLPDHPVPELRSYGLIRSNGSPKPAYSQMYGLLRNTVSSAGSCADLQGPEVAFIKPTATQKYKRGPLRISLSAADASGIKGIRLSAGNKKFTSVNKDAVVNSGKPITLKWFGAQCLKKGKHRLKAVAIDKLGNAQQTEVVLNKTTKPKKSKSCKAAKAKKK